MIFGETYNGRKLMRLAESRIVYRKPPANLTRDDEELFSDSYSYSTYDCQLSLIKNAQVSPSSVIYKNYILYPPSLYRSEDTGYYRFRYPAKMLLTARKVLLDSAKHHLLATDQESNGHFHWFTEVLPRLWLVKDRAAEFVLMLPDTPYMRSIAAESLRLVGLQFRAIFWMEDGELYKVPNLHHVSKVSRTGQVDDVIMKELNRALIGDNSRSTKKFYVSRERARFRKVLNEDELVLRLKPHGFEVIQPDNWSLVEQISAFSQCNTLVGIHGAGLTNCLFMPSGGKVVELVKREPNHGYWHLAESVGHKYFYYHGLPDSDLSLIGRGCNLTIPVDDFERAILKTL